jgi:hypothetical protein
MKTHQNSLKMISGKILSAGFYFFMILALYNTRANAQVKTPVIPPNSASLTANDGGIDKSILTIHDNYRDGSPDHINNQHLVALHIHNPITLKNFGPKKPLHGRKGKNGKGKKSRKIHNAPFHRHR